MKWFDDIFSKSKLMIISGFLAVVGYAFLAVNCFISPAPFFGMYATFSALIAALLICYKKGETSCQKALSGAILGTLIFYYWQISFGVFGYCGIVSIAFIEQFMTILLTIVFINHLLLQIDHKGDSKIIKISQVMLTIAVIWETSDVIAMISVGGKYYDVINSFSLLSAVTMITCMESRIQKYKAIRSASIADGTWTEEKRQKYKKIFKF